jgi:hypothetical protein
MKPRVFFGTMYSGEAEYEMCKNAIHIQRELKNLHHEVIEGLPEKEAHNELWTSWEKEKSHFDLFVKIDADTILCDDHAISRVWELFNENKRVTGAQLRLHDFFTDDLISGLNFFTPIVRFNTSPDLYCDRVDWNHDVVLKGESVKHLEPIGWHAKFPSDKQSFHYGYHRALKGQTTTLKNLTYVWLKTNDRSRMFAVLGVMAAMKNRTRGADHSYGNDTFEASFSLVAKEDFESLHELCFRFVQMTGLT